MFNANFRQITFAQIEKIEINCRCRISNYFAETYGVLGYVNSENFADTEYHNIFLRDIEEEIGRNSKAPFVRNFRENYEGGQLPIYALVEVFSFGTLSKFFKNMKNPDKKAVAKFPKTPNNPWNIRNTYTISSTKRKTTLQNTVLIIEFE